MQNRIELTVARFTHIATELGFNLIDMPTAAWVKAAPADDTNLHRPFGFLPPIDNDLFFSPDVIAQQGAHLNDDDFKSYLDVLQVHIYKHVTHEGDPEVERIIDRAVYDMAPGSVQLLSEVQMRALDGAAR